MNSHNEIDFFFFAGEQSGDLHGGKLLMTLKKYNPNLRCVGVGGNFMRAQGLECLMDVDLFQVMGFFDVIVSLPRLWRHFKKIRNYILQKRPKIVVFIDFPDFNLRMASSLRKHGFKGKLIQYICPSVWAWRKNRIKDMTASLDLVLSIFPFESQHFSGTPLEVQYIGNPSIESLYEYRYIEEWKKELGIKNSHDNLIGIFPGSRKSEIKQNLLKQLKTAELLLQDKPDLKFGLSVANDSLLPLISDKIKKTKLEKEKNLFLIPKDYIYELMRDCRVAIATSGTITLELGLHQTPTIVVYHVSISNWMIAKYLFRLNLPYYCIVNIALNQKIFPELIHRKFTVENLYRHTKELYQDTFLRKNCIKKCHELYKLLHLKDVNKRAVKAIEKFLP